MTDEEEIDEIYNKMKAAEQEGAQNILKYFDRIHDKLFSFNNILIAGYFALSQIYKFVSIYLILVPIVNLFILLLIEYRMMGKSRFEASVTKKTSKELDENGKSIVKTNLYSLLTIGTTFIVTIIFVFSLFRAKQTPPEKIESQPEKIVQKINAKDIVFYKNKLIGTWTVDSTKNATLSFYDDSAFFVDKFEYYKYEINKKYLIFDYVGIKDTATILKLSNDSLILKRQSDIKKYIKFIDP